MILTGGIGSSQRETRPYVTLYFVNSTRKVPNTNSVLRCEIPMTNTLSHLKFFLFRIEHNVLRCKCNG